MRLVPAAEIARAIKLAQVEAALLALLRDAGPEYDGLELSAHVDGGQTVIDLMYTRGGVPMAGESL